MSQKAGSLWPATWNEGSQEPPDALEAKRRRAYFPRSRGGCVTCKRRRVKCDKRHPYCIRCEKSPYTCSGYPEQGRAAAGSGGGTSHAAAAAALPALKPKTELPRGPACFQARAQDGLLMLHPSYMSLFNLSGKDALYLDTFRVGVPDLCTHSIMEQVLWDESVRESVLAISGLYRANIRTLEQFDQLKSLPISMVRLDKKNTSQGHYKSAIFHHVKAMAIFRQKMQSPTSLAVTEFFLNSSMLFITFEQMQSNYDAVDQLLEGTLLAVRDSLKRLRAHETAGGDSVTLLNSPFRNLRILISNFYQQPCVLSPLTAFLNHDKNQTPRSDISPPEGFPEEGDPLEIVFAFWRCDMSQTQVFFREALYLRDTGTLAAATEDATDAATACESVQDRLEQFKLKHAQWKRRASEELRRETDEAKRTSWMIIELNSMINITILEGILDPTETTYDALHGEFGKFLDRLIPLLKCCHDKVKKRMVSGFLPAVCLIACKCRDKHLRTRVLGMFDELAAAGPWGSQYVLKSVRSMISLEEAHRDRAGNVPLEARYAWTDLTWNFESQQLVTQFKKLAVDENKARVETYFVTNFSDSNK